MNNAQRINQDSGDTEYYTPSVIVECARRVMGGIDLDPASSIIANSVISAERFYTAEDDGLSQSWSGRVWMNHPFSGGERACSDKCTKKKCIKRGHCIDKDIPSNADWIDALVLSYEHGDVSMACCITYASTSERWFQPLLQYPQCYLAPRINYYLPDGTKKQGVTKGSVVTFVGPERLYSRFAEAFSAMGRVMIPYRAVSKRERPRLKPLYGEFADRTEDLSPFSIL